MKFARELERDLVPEWRAKYLDYKIGKKKVKAIARALRTVNQTPKTPARHAPTSLLAGAAYQSPTRTRNSSDALRLDSQHLGPTPISTPVATPQQEPANPGQEHSWGTRGDGEAGKHSPTKATPAPIKKNTPFQTSTRDSSTAWDSGAITNYGSFVSSPPANIPPLRPPSLELPDPALPPDGESFARHNRAWCQNSANPYATPNFRQSTHPNGHPYEVGATHTPMKSSTALLHRHRNVFKPRRTASHPNGGATPDRPRLIRRMFSTTHAESPHIGDVPLAGYRELDTRQAEFDKFLDSELDKIESFYKAKEHEAAERLLVLRQQLHEMRDRRIEEVQAMQRARDHHKREQDRLRAEGIDGGTSITAASGPSLDWRHPINSVIGVGHHVGKNTKALVKMEPNDVSPNVVDIQAQMNRQDFERRPTHTDEVPYRSAKRKLRLALQEFYRGLELLKSYALVNRTAFRKLNKKYDKVVKARPTGRFLTEKVNKAWFVQSEVLEGQIVAVEDLYARYFERGNHKVAVGKLRSRSNRPSDHNGSVFRNGLVLAAGAVFGVQGLVYGAEHLYSEDATVRVQSSYLLQIYGGYSLTLLLVLLFCLDCRIWVKAKINYVFIFEFDPRHNLDWHQLCELPCLLCLLLGMTIWLNFQQSAQSAMFLYWPVFLAGISALILFFPAPILYHKSRAWWAYSNFRLLLAGIYPVEFRDFFLGDMFCSLTYAMGNVVLFFCLYANQWNNPGRCNSSHSRLLGFFSTLPGIWRGLQCLRRYYDTRNAFPHLVNFGKYSFTILTYMSLSLYRIDQTFRLKALFIACASVNAVYCSVWDLAMDWSLGNPYAEHHFLREVLGYKKAWYYYVAMAIDPILRFNWIFYVIFGNEIQHSALLSYMIGLSEVGRRAMWTLFRVENEHCTNVGRFRASRDVPLPYDMAMPSPSAIEESRDQFADQMGSAEAGRLRPAESHVASGVQVTPDVSQAASGSLRRRQGSTTVIPSPMQRGIARVGTIMTEAHAQDFERRRRPGGTPLERQATYEGRHQGKVVDPEGLDSESDEDAPSEGHEENEEDRLRVGDILERRRSAVE
ncbi:MAG: hypothetical protein LQ337_003069 [Flavoplaca oasis]|nr:MAG: hypothetical protein LQ337_003069 [Flavoplaca oasis]